MRLLVNHIQLGHILGGILLVCRPPAPKQQQCLIVHLAAAQLRDTRLLDLGVYTQTWWVINDFWRKTFPFSGCCRAMCLAAFYIIWTFWMEHFAEGVLDCSEIPFQRMGSAVWMPRHGAALISFLPARCSWVTELRVPRERAHSAPGCTRIDPHFLRHSSSHVQLIARKSDENWCNSAHPAFAWPGPKCF